MTALVEPDRLRAWEDEADRLKERLTALLRLIEAARALSDFDRTAPVAVAPKASKKITPAVVRENRTTDPDPPSPVTPKSRAAVEVQEQIRELWSSDLTKREIAEKVGRSPARVYQIGKALGLPSWRAADARAQGHVLPTAKPKPEQPALPVAPAPRAPEPAAKAPPRVLPADPLPDAERILTFNGATLDLFEERITNEGKDLDLTNSQARLLAILFRAAPAPVGHEFILPKLYGSIPKATAEERFGIVTRNLRNGLPTIGLELRGMKGVGLAIAEAGS